MLRVLAMPAVMLAACASAPADVEQVARETHRRITYRDYAAFDRRYVAPGTVGEGNCAVFAQTAFVDLSKLGRMPSTRYCVLRDGRAHVWVELDGWAVDARWPYAVPAPEAAADCR